MHRLVVLLAAASFTTSIFGGETSRGERDKQRLKMCTTRNATENVEGCTGAFFTMYIYNENTSECEELPKSICYRGPEHGVFFTLSDCAYSCANGKGPQYCTAGPHEPTNDTCTEKERLWYDDSDSCEPNEAWYYNASAEECQKYKTCKDPWKFPGNVNGFSKRYFCGKKCEGFIVSNINGSVNGSGQSVISCDGKPPAVCSDEDYEDGNDGTVAFFYINDEPV
uniref:Putative secreted protein n=1 Tax=Amblyomma cajennense TaxID=34607 RepID=A0A023FR38_AMBCJ